MKWGGKIHRIFPTFSDVCVSRFLNNTFMTKSRWSSAYVLFWRWAQTVNAIQRVAGVWSKSSFHGTLQFERSEASSHKAFLLIREKKRAEGKGRSAVRNVLNEMWIFIGLIFWMLHLFVIKVPFKQDKNSKMSSKLHILLEIHSVSLWKWKSNLYRAKFNVPKEHFVFHIPRGGSLIPLTT